MKKIIFLTLLICLFASFHVDDEFQTDSLAPDFSAVTMNGDAFRLSEHRGSIVFIDFWASWCLPCRKQNVKLLKIQEKYRLLARRSGLRVIFINISLDTNKDLWRNAVLKDELNTKRQICDAKGWDSEIVKAYKVKKVPASFLIGTDGKIIAKDIWENKLDETIDALYKQLSN